MEGESSFLGGYAVDRCFSLIGEILILLADCASLDVVSYSLIYVWPPIFLFGLMDCFVPAGCPAMGWLCIRAIIPCFTLVVKATALICDLHDLVIGELPE